MTIERPDYSVFIPFDTWKLDDAIEIVFSESRYKKEAEASSPLDRSELKKLDQAITKQLKDNAYKYSDDVKYEDLYLDGNEAPETDDDCEIIQTVDIDNTLVDIKRFIKFAVWEKLPFPQELVDVFMKKDDHKPSASATMSANEGQEQYEPITGYEDIISDETILKLKELPPHLMKQQVAMLAGEKKKWDASIIAAAKVGLLFYEEGLSKPTKVELFVAEYKKHFDKLPPLPKTTIERIYKHLPDGYRRTTDGGKVAGEQQDIDAIIKAAAFAGYQYGSKDIANVDNFVKALNRESYSVPDENVLTKIIAIAGKLE